MVFGLLKDDFISRRDSQVASNAGWAGQTPESAPKILACLVNLEKGKIHTLTEGEIAIGRSSACEILINTDATVSRRHATLTMVDGVFYLQDLGSRNGTSVNGQAVKGTRIKLNPDDQIGIGKTIYVFSPIGISEALYGSQLKEISFKSRVDLSSNAARKLVSDLVTTVKNNALKVSKAALNPDRPMQTEGISLRK